MAERLVGKLPSPEVRRALKEHAGEPWMALSAWPVPKRGYCIWCGEKIQNHFGRFWCGNPCRIEYQSRLSARRVRDLVGERDGGVCYHCGLDTSLILDARKELWGIWKWVTAQPAPDYWELNLAWGPWMRDPRQFWEVERVRALERGGGVAFGLENFRTICRRCLMEPERRKL